VGAAVPIQLRSARAAIVTTIIALQVKGRNKKKKKIKNKKIGLIRYISPISDTELVDLNANGTRRKDRLEYPAWEEPKSPHYTTVDCFSQSGCEFFHHAPDFANVQLMRDLTGREDNYFGDLWRDRGRTGSRSCFCGLPWHSLLPLEIRNDT